MKRKRTRKTVPRKSFVLDKNEEAFLDFVKKNAQRISSSDVSDDEVGEPESVTESSSYSSLSSSSSGSFDELLVNRMRSKSAEGLFSDKQKSKKLKKGMETEVKSRYNKMELEAALMVITKVMKMDEAQPFNIPADPVALRPPGGVVKQNYFGVRDVPVDFGTICSNLRNGVKYMNSEDVFKDVEYIWENCCKCYKKGDYAFYLMKRVKKKFMKYWIAAGLYNEQPWKTSDQAVRQSRLKHAWAPSSCPHPEMSQQLLPNNIWPQLSQLPQSTSSQNYQLEQHQSSSDQLQFSALQRNGPSQSQPAECLNLLHQSSEPTQKKKRGRGPNKLQKLWDLNDGERIAVPINNLGQPVGPESSKLSNLLGSIARNGHMAPLTYVSWREMPDETKEKMWQLVQSKFEIDPMCKPWVLKTLGKRWRDWKAELKAIHYYPHDNDEDRLKDCDPRVLPDQWQGLISYWNSDEAKLHCAKNRANRAKQKALHTSGRKSFARIREEERGKRSDGKELSRTELYILTHTRKDGQPVDDEAATIISKLCNHSTGGQTTAEGHTDSDDAFFQVMGAERGGRVRTYGLGPTPVDLWGRKCGCGKNKRIGSAAKKSSTEEESRILEKMEVIEQKNAHMEAQIARMTSNMEKFLDKISGSSKILSSDEVLGNSNSLEGSLHPQAHSSSYAASSEKAASTEH